MAKKTRAPQEVYIPKVDDKFYLYYRNPLRIYPVPWRYPITLKEIDNYKILIKNGRNNL